MKILISFLFLFSSRLRAEDEYASKLMAIGVKYRGEVETRPELWFVLSLVKKLKERKNWFSFFLFLFVQSEFPPIFTSLIGDIEQIALARQQLREQILSEIYDPLDAFLAAKQDVPIKKDMNFVKSSLVWITTTFISHLHFLTIRLSFSFFLSWCSFFFFCECWFPHSRPSEILRWFARTSSRTPWRSSALSIPFWPKQRMM